MEKTCILHIGLPKTATTSFQNAVFAHRDMLLSEHRMFYPSVDANLTNSLCTMFLDDPRKHVGVKVMGITTSEGAERLRQQYRDALERDIESADWDTLVLSAEGLCNLPAASLSALREWVSKYVSRWRVLLWLRNPLSFVGSNMQQMLKGGHTIDGMLSELPLPNFKGRLSNAFQAFGRESVELTAFEDATGEPGGVVAAFCRRLGLNEDLAMKIAGTSRHENESMSMLAAYALNSLNRQRPLFGEGGMNKLRSPGESAFFLRIKGPKFVLPLGMRQAIRVAARPDVEWLNQTMGAAYYPDIFEDESSHDPDDEVLPRETLDSLARVISDMINKIKHPRVISK